MRNRNYSRNKSYDFIPFFVFPACALSLYFSSSFPDTTPVFVWRILTLLFFCIYLCVYNRFFILQVLSYNKHKNLENECSYKITGWNRFCENSIIQNHKNWYSKVSITLKINPDKNPEILSFISNACLLICEDCNNAESEFEGSLQRWEYSDYTLCGSANCSVIGLLHRFIINDLNKADKNNNTINALEFVFSGKINKHTKTYNEPD